MSNKTVHHMDEEDMSRSASRCEASNAPYSAIETSVARLQADELVTNGDFFRTHGVDEHVAHHRDYQTCDIACSKVQLKPNDTDSKCNTDCGVLLKECNARSFIGLYSETDAASDIHADHMWNGTNVVDRESVTANHYQCAENSHHFDSLDSSSLTTSYPESVNSGTEGAVGGYVNGFLMNTKGAKSEQSADRKTGKPFSATQTCDAGNACGGYSVIHSYDAKSEHNSHQRYRGSMNDPLDDGVFDYLICSGGASDFTSCRPAANNFDLDVCLDDYIDADMHLSPVAGSLSRSSSSLSDDSDILVNKSDKLDEAHHKSFQGTSTSNTADQNCRSGGLSKDYAENCIVSSSCSAFEGMHVGRNTGNIVNVVQSSGHPSSSSFDSLPASLPSPCGNFNDGRAVSSLVTTEQFLFADVPSNSFSNGSDCSLHFQRRTESSSCVMSKCQNESYWLSMSGNSDLDSPGSECRTCSEVLHCNRKEPWTEHMDELDNFQKCCISSSMKDNSSMCTRVNGHYTTHSASLDEAIMTDCTHAVYNDKHSANGTCTKRLSCDAGLNQMCEKCLQHHMSCEAAAGKVPFCSISHLSDYESVFSDVARSQLDRNFNKCYNKSGDASSSGHSAMRLSTSLTFENAKVDCDERLTQSYHQPSRNLSSGVSMEEDKPNKASCRFNVDGEYSVASKEPMLPHSAVSSDVGSSQLGRISPLASDRININKLMRSLGIRDHQIEISSLFDLNCSSKNASLCDFLLTCSRIGTSAQRLVTGISRITGDRVYGKFFNFHPRRRVNLKHWLAYWLKLGAVPLVTVKMERRSSEGTKMWQHLVVDGIQPEGISIGCPSEIISDDVLLAALSSGPTIEVSRSEIISRWHSNCNLNQLMACSDSAWLDLNVLGQTVNVLRENQLSSIAGYRPQCTSVVVLPTHLRSGVTVFCTSHSSAYERLIEITDDLPLACTKDRSISDSNDTVSRVDGDVSSLSVQHVSSHPYSKPRRKKKSVNK